MSITQQHTLWCDYPGCDEWDQATVSRRELVVLAARDAGWIRIKEDSKVYDLCKRHRKWRPVTR